MKKEITMIMVLGLSVTFSLSTAWAANRVPASKRTPSHPVAQASPNVSQEKNPKVSNRVPASKRGNTTQVLPEQTEMTTIKKKVTTNRVPASKKMPSDNQDNISSNIEVGLLR